MVARSRPGYIPRPLTSRAVPRAARVTGGCLRRARGERPSVPGADQLRDIPAGERGRRQSTPWLNPVAGHIEALQSRQLPREAPSQNARRREPALDTALPVAGEMLERRRGSQIAVLKMISEARKSLLENPDDFAEQCLFSLRIIAGSAPFEVSPIVEPASKSNYQDGLPRRTESRIAAEHCDFEPVMPSRVVHYQRTRERQADCLGRFRKGPIDAQRCLEQRREGLAVTVGVAELFVEIPALKHLEEQIGRAHV